MAPSAPLGLRALLAIVCLGGFAGCYVTHGGPLGGGSDGSPPVTHDGASASPDGGAISDAGMDASVDAGPMRLWDAEVREIDPDAALDFDAAGMHSCHEDTIFLPVDRPGCTSIVVSGADLRECETSRGVYGGQPVTVLNLVAKHLGLRVEFLGAPGCSGRGCAFRYHDQPETCDCSGGGVVSAGEPPRVGTWQTSIARSESAYSLVVGGSLSRWRITACVRD